MAQLENIHEVPTDSGNGGAGGPKIWRVFNRTGSATVENGLYQFDNQCLLGNIHNATWDESDKSITATGAFLNYSFVEGDRIYISEGTGATVGWYEVDSKFNDDIIILTSSIATSPGDLGTGDIEGGMYLVTTQNRVQLPPVVYPMGFGLDGGFKNIRSVAGSISPDTTVLQTACHAIAMQAVGDREELDVLVEGLHDLNCSTSGDTNLEPHKFSRVIPVTGTARGQVIHGTGSGLKVVAHTMEFGTWAASSDSNAILVYFNGINQAFSR